jgi:hypothetical protein
MVFESLTDTSSDSDESGGYEIIILTLSSDDESSDDDGNEEGERLCTPVNGTAVSAEALISDPDWSSDSDDDFLEIPGPIPEGEFVKWIGRTARRRLEPILSQAQKMRRRCLHGLTLWLLLLLCTGSVCVEESLLEYDTGIAAIKTRICNLPSIHYVCVS